MRAVRESLAVLLAVAFALLVTPVVVVTAVLLRGAS